MTLSTNNTDEQEPFPVEELLEEDDPVRLDPHTLAYAIRLIRGRSLDDGLARITEGIPASTMGDDVLGPAAFDLHMHEVRQREWELNIERARRETVAEERAALLRSLRDALEVAIDVKP